MRWSSGGLILWKSYGRYGYQEGSGMIVDHVLKAGVTKGKVDSSFLDFWLVFPMLSWRLGRWKFPASVCNKSQPRRADSTYHQLLIDITIFAQGKWSYWDECFAAILGDYNGFSERWSCFDFRDHAICTVQHDFDNVGRKVRTVLAPAACKVIRETKESKTIRIRKGSDVRHFL